ncbi:MAG: exo-alpha-sialidase [Bacteroidetes bacterium]|nr:exo-alpha-sialidase [Bacteroidota bacterium]
MKNLSLLLVFLFVYFQSQSQFKNTKLTEHPEEIDFSLSPSVTINKTNPKTIVIDAGNGHLIFSNDGGTQWTNSKLSSTGRQSITFFNPKGILHSLKITGSNPQNKDTQADQIVGKESLDEGATWTQENSIAATPSVHFNNLRAATHSKKNIIALTWSQFDNYGSSDSNCQSNIFFSRSPNGSRWSKPVQLNESPGDCQDDDFTTKGATPVIGTDEKIYVAWANRGNIYFDRSFDDGTNWLQNDLLIAKQEGGWKFDISGVHNHASLPILSINTAPNRQQGQLYLVWADQKNGPDNTDIWMIRSMNRGDYWSKPLKVNKDSSRTHQFLPATSVDPSNGNLYIAYYDRRNYEDDQTDVYLACSRDGGSTFNEVKISDRYFIPEASKKFIGHIAVDAFGGVVIVVWSRMDEGESSLWSCVLKESDLIKLKK